MFKIFRLKVDINIIFCSKGRGKLNGKNKERKEA